MATIDLEKCCKRSKVLSGVYPILTGMRRSGKITAEQWPKLKDFMADLMWIEHVGARAFSAMSKST